MAEKRRPKNVLALIAQALWNKEAKKPKVKPTLPKRFSRRKGDPK